MTLGAIHAGVLAHQLEVHIVVVERFSITIHAVMAGKTVIAKGEQMCLGEANVYLVVAGLAVVGSEGGDITVMAIVAGKWKSRAGALMSIQ